MGESPSLPAIDPLPVLKYNTGETAQLIESLLCAILEGVPPHPPTGWGLVSIKVEQFRVAEIFGGATKRFPVPKSAKP